MKSSKKIKPRRQARCYAMQALYQWHLNATLPSDLITHFEQDNDILDADVNYFKMLLEGTISHVADIDATMTPFLDRPIVELNPVELAVLRFSVYELKYHLDIPYRVVINEALEVVKQFGSDQGYKYVNAILDKIAPTLREAEYQANKK